MERYQEIRKIVNENIMARCKQTLGEVARSQYAQAVRYYAETGEGLTVALKGIPLV